MLGSEELCTVASVRCPAANLFPGHYHILIGEGHSEKSILMLIDPSVCVRHEFVNRKVETKAGRERADTDGNKTHSVGWRLWILIEADARRETVWRFSICLISRGLRCPRTE